MTVAALPIAPAAQRTAWTRVAIGLAQGLALYWLYDSGEAHQWPSTAPALFVPLLLVLWYVPIGAILGLGNLRPATLAAWLGVATVVLAGLALHDVSRGMEPQFSLLFPAQSPSSVPPTPSSTLNISVFFMLFIAHSLVSAGDADRRFVARYQTYFDIAWKLEVQVALAGIFTALFWALLWLGSSLFELIHITAVRDLIEHRWFATPATTLAFAYALHVSDVRVGLVTGMRNLLHVLLSWLLPLATLLVVGFLLTLPFTGLAALWQTRHAAQLMFWATAVLVVLINTAYRDGERAPPAVLRFAGTLASVALVSLVELSAYALFLRVHQYGWTADRVTGAAILAISGLYAVGYLIAAVPRAQWLKPLEWCNIVAAFAIIAVMLALLTPIADPARIAVADQVARLKDGRIIADKFDYTFLRLGGGRYGRAALYELETSGDSDAIRNRAKQAQAATYVFAPNPPSLAELSSHIAVYPAGSVLPPSFLTQTWTATPASVRYMLPSCLINVAQRCEAYLVRLDGSGKDQVLLIETAAAQRSALFSQQPDNTWKLVGTLSPYQAHCESVREKLRAGQFSVEPAVNKDIVIGDVRLTPTPPATFPSKCN